MVKSDRNFLSSPQSRVLYFWTRNWRIRCLSWPLHQTNGSTKKCKKWWKFWFISRIMHINHREVSPVFFHSHLNSNFSFCCSRAFDWETIFFCELHHISDCLKNEESYYFFPSPKFNSWFCTKSDLHFLSRLQSTVLHFQRRNWRKRCWNWSFHQTPLSH